MNVIVSFRLFQTRPEIYKPLHKLQPIGCRIAVMRLSLVIAISFLAIGSSALLLAKSNARAKIETTSALPAVNPKPNFDSDIKPILQAKCQPCHFQGGKVYDQMPFDKPETITRLGTRLFTRIKDEKEQRLIREFLDAP